MAERFWDGVGRALKPLLALLMLPLQILVIPLVVVAVIAGVWTWYRYGPSFTPSSVPAALAEGVEAACAQVAEALPSPTRSPRPILVVPLAGDREIDDGELLVTAALREAIDAEGRYRCVKRSKGQGLTDALLGSDEKPQRQIADPAEAGKAAEAAGAEVFLLGRVDRLEVLEDTARVAFDVQLFEVGVEEPLFQDSFSNRVTAESPPETAQTPSSGAPDARAPGPSLLVYVAVSAFALIWPALMIPLMRRALKQDSNLANLLAILAVTAVPAVVAWPVVFSTGAGLWTILVYTAGVLLVALWSMTIMSWVAEME